MGFEIINKILMMLFVLCSLNSFRHTYYFIQAWVKSNNDSPTKYRMSTTSLLFLGLSLAYITTSLMTGITI